MSATETDTGTTVRLIRHGNSWVLPLEPQMVRELGMDENAPVSVVSDGHSLIISPMSSDAHRAKLEAALAKAHEEYGETLRKLAE